MRLVITNESKFTNLASGGREANSGEPGEDFLRRLELADTELSLGRNNKNNMSTNTRISKVIAIPFRARNHRKTWRSRTFTAKFGQISILVRDTKTDLPVERAAEGPPTIDERGLCKYISKCTS